MEEFTSSIEKELVKATKFKGGKFADHQDYLASLLRAIDSKLSDQDYDSLSDAAVEWHHTAVKAMESKKQIPDFPDIDDDAESEMSEELGNGEDSDPESLPLTDERHPLHRAGPPDEEGEGDEEGEDQPANDAVVEEEPEIEQEAQPEESEPEEADPDPQAKPAKKVAKKKSKEAQKKPSERSRPVYENLSGDKDRYGVIIGTRTHKAIQMYEEGCTAKEIMDELGGRFYNILRKLKEEGHRVEKDTDSKVWRLTHKDDVAAKAAKRKAKSG